MGSSRPKSPSRSTSFFAQPGTLAAVIGGAVVGLLCAILCVMFVVYRMRKKDEGSYALDEPKRSPTVNAYAKHPNSREFMLKNQPTTVISRKNSNKQTIHDSYCTNAFFLF